MTLSQRIEADYIIAYKAKDALRLSVLRLVKAAAQNLLVERFQKPLDEADWMDILDKQGKQRRESITQYRAAGREDLAGREEDELAVLQTYMPEQLCGDRLASIVAEVIAQTGATGPKDMGRVMQALAAAYKGQYDGKEASENVRQALQRP